MVTAVKTCVKQQCERKHVLYNAATSLTAMEQTKRTLCWKNTCAHSTPYVTGYVQCKEPQQINWIWLLLSDPARKAIFAIQMPHR